MSDFTITPNPSRFTIQQTRENNTGGGSNFPPRLKQCDQWLVVHDAPENDARHKSPKYPAKGWNDGDLLSFKDALHRADTAENTGIAFAFNKKGPFIGVDLDDVTHHDDFTEEALAIVERLNTYTEISSSGSGLHIIAKGERLADRKTRADLTEEGHIEVYDKGQYFVLTGDVYGDNTAVKNRDNAIREVQTECLPRKETTNNVVESKSVTDQKFWSKTSDVTPKQVHRTIRAYTNHSKKNVDEEVLRLWAGSNEGHSSKSEADLALTSQLYFWCKGNPDLMDQCFRASGRMRTKWDEVHSANGDTYGEMTIQKACRTNEKTFNSQYVR
jgi:putative DNA primase/helicase